MRIILLAAASLCVGVTLGQQYPTTTPVPILKQINKHNEDGSYSYGFEAADGSYKIESKYPNGEVHGKYGFVDDTGNVREIEYGASRRGFEPSGTGINVPPPTLQGNSIAEGKDDPDDDGQYREDPSIYYTDPRYTNGERYDPVPNTPIYNHQLQRGPLPHTPASASRFAAIAAPAYRQPTPAPALAAAAQYQIKYQAPQYQPHQYQPQYQQPQYQQPQYQQPQYQQPQYQQPQYQQPAYQPAQYQQEYRPQYKTQIQRQVPAAPQYRQPAQYELNQYRGHPASRIDPNTGSYSVNYKR